MPAKAIFSVGNLVLSWVSSTTKDGVSPVFSQYDPTAVTRTINLSIGMRRFPFHVTIMP